MAQVRRLSVREVRLSQGFFHELTTGSENGRLGWAHDRRVQAAVDVSIRSLRHHESLFMSNGSRRKLLGPGLLVAAAFIGPGTITAASKAGAQFGYTLLWAITFSVIATIVLQEMSARLGLIAQTGLGDAIRTQFRNRLIRGTAVGLVIFAIGFGNSAFQTGNLIGAAQGLSILTQMPSSIWAILLGLLAGAVLWLGVYGWLEKGLVVLVIVMSLLFVTAAVLAKPDLGALASGSVLPVMPTGSLMTVIALFGTTVVPYNLFLHASSVREHWREEANRDQALRITRWDTIISVVLGGLITVAVVTTAAAVFPEKTELNDISQMANQLKPALGGSTATVLFALGIFSAGFSSALTAPLAAAYAISGVLGWEADLKSSRFRAIWMVVLLTGLIFAVSFGKSPVQTITVAQVANGLLLPVIAIFLLIIVNRKSVLGEYRNRWLSNSLGVVVVLIVSLLAAWQITQAVKKAFAPAAPAIQSPPETAAQSPASAN